MVQTIGSAGESVAAGAIFTLPALFHGGPRRACAIVPSLVEIGLIALCGGVLGVLMMGSPAQCADRQGGTACWPILRDRLVPKS